jgi:hypothetical protein
MKAFAKTAQLPGSVHNREGTDSAAERPVSNQYALLSYSTDNLGDEIQSIAARQFLPRIDALCDRDYLADFESGAAEKYKLIMNGWYMNRPENWPPSAAILPFMVSMHLSQEVFKENIKQLPPLQTLLKERNLDYIRAHAPIGGRDLWTCEQLHKRGVEAYFSGCLTLALERPDSIDRQDYVCLNEVGQGVEAAVRNRTRSTVLLTSHLDQTTRDPWLRMRKAEELIRIYAAAKCVITTRLHCAMPCLALNTPVLFLPTQPDSYRFSGLAELVRCVSPERLIAGDLDFDFDTPLPNPDRYLPFRRDLVLRCEEFVSG